MIPKILFRTVPTVTTDQQEEWWEQNTAMTPGWRHITYRDGTTEMNPEHWASGYLWDRCDSGAHKADLIRLDAMFRHGGFYIDSDVQVLRPLEPLLSPLFVAGWEDETNIPNAMFGSVPNSPIVNAMLKLVTGDWFERGVWWSGPGVFKHVLLEQGWGIVERALLLPPGSFYPYHYKEKREINAVTPSGKRALEERLKDSPWAYAVHHWHHSWRKDAHREG